VMDVGGNHRAFSIGRPSRYVVMTDDVGEPQELLREEILAPERVRLR